MRSYGRIDLSLMLCKWENFDASYLLNLSPDLFKILQVSARGLDLFMWQKILKGNPIRFQQELIQVWNSMPGPLGYSIRASKFETILNKLQIHEIFREFAICSKLFQTLRPCALFPTSKIVRFGMKTFYRRHSGQFSKTCNEIVNETLVAATPKTVFLHCNYLRSYGSLTWKPHPWKFFTASNFPCPFAYPSSTNFYYYRSTCALRIVVALLTWEEL